MELEKQIFFPAFNIYLFIFLKRMKTNLFKLVNSSLLLKETQPYNSRVFCQQ